MFKILTLMTVLALGAFSTTAQAQNFGTRTSDNFTGPYAGLTAGYGWTDLDANFTAGGVTASDDADINGWQGGLLGGYGFQFGQGYDYVWNGYVGLELAYEWSGADDSVFGVGIDKDDIFSVTLRPGLSWGDTALGYGIVGYSRTQFKAAGDDDWVDGLVLGLGAEVGGFGPVKTRLEYVHTWYDDQDFSSGPASLSTDAHDNAVKVGAIYRF